MTKFDYSDLDTDSFQVYDPIESSMPFINAIRPELERLAPDYVAFRDKFGWGHMDIGITVFEWMDDMAIYLHEGMGWEKADVHAWIFGDMDGDYFGICKTTGKVVCVSVESPTDVDDGKHSFEQFIRRTLG